MDPIPIRLPEELQARVDQMAVTLSISRSAVLRLAVRQWLEAADQHGMNPLLRESTEKRPGRPPAPPVSYPKAVAVKRGNGTTKKQAKP